MSFTPAIALLLAVPLTLNLPPVRTTVTIDNQSLTITVSGVISQLDDSTFALRLAAGLFDLQQHITPLLQSQLNQSNRCGDRLTVERATLDPAPPAARLTAFVHYEKWACAKIFGKEQVKRLAGGDGSIEVLLTPVARDNAIHMEAEVGRIEADGNLGELLRSGSLGAAVREKIRRQVVTTVERATDLKAVIPAPFEKVAQLEKAAFIGTAGHLGVEIEAKLQVPAKDVPALVKAIDPSGSR